MQTIANTATIARRTVYLNHVLYCIVLRCFPYCISYCTVHTHTVLYILYTVLYRILYCTVLYCIVYCSVYIVIYCNIHIHILSVQQNFHILSPHPAYLNWIYINFEILTDVFFLYSK